MSADIYRWLVNLDSRIARLEVGETITPGAPAGAHSVLSATHTDTLAAAVVRGDLVIGNSTPKWSRLAKGSAYAVLTGDGTDTAWTTYLLSGTAGGKTTFAVTSAKTLTLTAADSYNLTVPITGTAALGTGTATLLATWNTVNTLQAGPANASGYLKNNGAGALSWDAGTTMAHNLLSATHTDALADSAVAGDLLVGNATPKWARLAFGLPGLVNYVGAYDAETGPSWKAASSNPGANMYMLHSSVSGYLQLVRLGLGTAPTAQVHCSAGTAAAGTAPLKLTTGVALAAIEDGALEYHSSHLYFSIGAVRYQIDQQPGAAHKASHAGGGSDKLKYARQALLYVSGDLAVGGNQSAEIVYRGPTATITRADGHIKTAPTDADLIFDINVNGTTIWSTQANRLTIAASATSGTQTSFNTTSVTDGQVITVDVDQVGSTIPGANATVLLELYCDVEAD